MNIKLNNRFIKIAVAPLAFITTSAIIVSTTIINLIIPLAKVKKHLKKVKKTYVIAKYYDEF